MRKIIKVVSFLGLFIPLLASCGENDGGGTYSSALKKAKESNFQISGKAYQVYYTTSDETYELEAFDVNNIINKDIVSTNLVYHYKVSDDYSFDETQSNTYFTKDDGYVYVRGLDLQNNVVDTPITVSNTNVKFTDYFPMPFANFEYTSLIELDDELLVDPTLAKEFAFNLTKLNLSYTKVSLKYKGNHFTSVTIYTSKSTSLIPGMSSSYRFDLTFKWGVKAKMPNVKPYAHTKEHYDLESALFAINKKISTHNFLATSLVETNTSSGTSTSQGLFYATEEAVYSNATDSSGNTYGYKKEGNSFYEFYLKKDGSINVYDEDPISSSYMYPRYNTSLFAPELFYYDSKENLYIAHEEFAYSLVCLLAPITEAAYYAEYVVELSIKLDNNKNFESLNIYYYDYSNNISANVKVTYSEFGTTALPFVLF